MSDSRHRTSHFGVRLILRGRCVGELADLAGGSEAVGAYARVRVYDLWRRVWHCDQWDRLSSISVLDEVNFFRVAITGVWLWNNSSKLRDQLLSQW